MIKYRKNVYIKPQKNIITIKSNYLIFYTIHGFMGQFFSFNLFTTTYVIIQKYLVNGSNDDSFIKWEKNIKFNDKNIVLIFICLVFRLHFYVLMFINNSAQSKMLNTKNGRRDRRGSYLLLLLYIIVFIVLVITISFLFSSC